MKSFSLSFSIVFLPLLPYFLPFLLPFFFISFLPFLLRVPSPIPLSPSPSLSPPSILYISTIPSLPLFLPPLLRPSFQAFFYSRSTAPLPFFPPSFASSSPLPLFKSSPRTHFSVQFLRLWYEKLLGSQLGFIDIVAYERFCG